MILKTTDHRSVAALMLSFFPLTSEGQDVVGNLPKLPTGFYEAANSVVEDESSLGDFDFSLGIVSLYDSNVTQGNDSGGRAEESDLLIQPTLRASYRLGNSRWHLGTRATVSRLTYLESEDFDSTNYSLRVYGGYQSKKLVASFSSTYASNGGVNRLAGDYLEQQTFSNGLLASYRFSPKTSLLASWDHSLTRNDTDGFDDSSSSTFGLSAVWRATPLLNVGPGIRYGVRSSRDDEEFTVIGPTLRLDYQLSTKVKLRSSIGLDYSDSPFGSDDALFNWSVSLNYKASERWGFDLRMIRDTRATLSAGGGFDQTSAYSLNYWRKIRRSKLQLGVSYEDRSPQDALVAGGGVRDSNFFRLSASVTTPVYKDEASLSFNVSWQDLSASQREVSWDGFQAGVGLQWNF